MPYLIDGHNLIGQLPDISLDEPDDEAQLILKLKSFSARTGQQCTVVFDHGVPGGVSHLSTRKIKVVFAPQHSNADQIIMGRIQRQKQPQQWIVVSSDHRVLETARRHRMQTLTSVEFIPILRRPPPPPRPDISEAADVRLSEDEVEEWLQMFNGTNNQEY